MGGETDGKILQRLDEWQKDELPGPVELYIRLMRAQIEARSTTSGPGPHLSDETVSERLGCGEPLLTFDELQLDWSKVESLFTEALSIVAEYVSLDASQGVDRLPQMAREWYEGRLSLAQSEDEPLIVAVYAAVKPFLVSRAEGLLPQVDQAVWRRGYCPICGGTPNLAVLLGEEGARWLVCPRCDSQWRFQRLECPFCGNKDQATLAYFPDGTGLYRLYVCDRCRGYLKAIDVRRSQSEVLLPLEWISTLDMDRQACDMGYVAGELTGTREDTA